MSKKVKITTGQIENLIEQGLLPGGPEHIDGLVKKQDASALAHHYAKSDDTGKQGILKKASETHGEVFANKIKIRAKGVLEGLSEEQIDLNEINTGSYNGKHFIDEKHSESKKPFYKNGEIINPKPSEDIDDKFEKKPNFLAKPVNEESNLDKQKNKNDDDIDELSTGSGISGGASDSESMDEQLNEELPEQEETIDETSTTASVGGQYSSKYFIAAPGHENKTVLWPGGKIIKPNTSTHNQGVNAFTVTKGKLKESIFEEGWMDKFKTGQDVVKPVSDFIKSIISKRDFIRSISSHSDGTIRFTFGQYFVSLNPSTGEIFLLYPDMQKYEVNRKQIGNELFSQLLACLQTGGTHLNEENKDMKNINETVNNIINVIKENMMDEPIPSSDNEQSFDDSIEEPDAAPEDENTDFDVVSAIVDYASGNAGDEEILKLFSHLIKNQIYDKLDDEIASTAHVLMSDGIISQDGSVDMEKYHQLVGDSNQQSQENPEQAPEDNSTVTSQIPDETQVDSTMDSGIPDDDSDLDEVVTPQQAKPQTRIPKQIIKKVADLQNLLAHCVDSQGNKEGIVDTTSTWGEAYIYDVAIDGNKVIIRSWGQNGKEEYPDIYDFNRDLNKYMHIPQDCYDALNHISKMAKKTIKSLGNVSQGQAPVDETTGSASSGQFNGPLRGRPTTPEDMMFEEEPETEDQISTEGLFKIVDNVKADVGEDHEVIKHLENVIKQYGDFDNPDSPVNPEAIAAFKNILGTDTGAEAAVHQDEPELSLQEEKISSAFTNLQKIRDANAIITKADMSDIRKEVMKSLKTKGVQFVEKVPEGEQPASEFIKIDNTGQQDEINMIRKGMEDLEYDNEPDELFQHNFENGINPSLKTAAVTDQFGNKYPAQDHANVIDSGLGDNLLKIIKKKKEAAKHPEPMYAKDPQPVTIVKEGFIDNVKNTAKDIYQGIKNVNKPLDGAGNMIKHITEAIENGISNLNFENNYYSFTDKYGSKYWVGNNEIKSTEVNNPLTNKIKVQTPEDVQLYKNLIQTLQSKLQQRVNEDEIVVETDEYVITKAEQEKINENIAYMKKLAGYKPEKHISTKGNKTDNSLFKRK